MALSDFDRDLLRRCLDGDAGAWDTFVDRFVGLVAHVVDQTARSRSQRLTPTDREDLIADVFLVFLQNDLGVLRRFRGGSSLATYLSVVARRVVVRRVMQRSGLRPLAEVAHTLPPHPVPTHMAAVSGSDEPLSQEPPPEQRLSDRDQVEQMLLGLPDAEALVVRLYHLEGKSYHEIGEQVGVPVNTIGPLLSRARTRLRQNTGQGAAG